MNQVTNLSLEFLLRLWPDIPYNTSYDTDQDSIKTKHVFKNLYWSFSVR